MNSLQKATTSENYQSVTFNGIWSWFSDPRAVYFEGKYKRTYAGWVDNYGDIHVGYYDHETQKIASTVVYDNLEIDDHNNPSILVDSTGKLFVFFNTHLQDQRPIFMRVSKNPEAIEHWEPLRELYVNNDEKYPNATIKRHTYTNPVQLSKENRHIYLFWRGINLQPSYSISKDNGKTWVKGEILVQSKASETLKTPYTKVYSSGKSKIHFTFTDGHPTKENKNTLYYMYYENGAFYKADGSNIGAISELPISISKLDVIHTSETVKSWNWDIAEDVFGNPIVTYVKFPNTHTHIYTYATFHNNRWTSYEVVKVDGWFPESRPNIAEPEPHYSGGIVIDHESPNTIYVSVKRNGIFEIEEWTTNNRGKSWGTKSITKNSSKNNVRPFAVKGAKKGNPLQVLWLQNKKYSYYAADTRGETVPLKFEDRYQTSIKMNLQKPNISQKLTQETLVEFLRTIIEYQLENVDYPTDSDTFNYNIAYAGLQAFYQISQENRYGNEFQNWLQYQTNHDAGADENDTDILSVLWNNGKELNRIQQQKIEALTTESFANYREDIEYASMLRTIRNFGTTIEKIEEIKKSIAELSIAYSKQLKTKAFKEKSLREKLYLTYGLAAAVNENLLDEKYIQNIIEYWKLLQIKIMDQSYKNLHADTYGIALLAGKEIIQLLKKTSKR